MCGGQHVQFTARCGNSAADMTTPTPHLNVAPSSSMRSPNALVRAFASITTLPRRGAICVKVGNGRTDVKALDLNTRAVTLTDGADVEAVDLRYQRGGAAVCDYSRKHDRCDDEAAAGCHLLQVL